MRPLEYLRFEWEIDQFNEDVTLENLFALFMRRSISRRMNIHGKIGKKDRILSTRSHSFWSLFYHADLEKREGCGVVAHERHESHMSQ